MASHVSQDVVEMAMEAALHMDVAKRCARAYVHELRNGLQGVYASVDVLTRMLDGKVAKALDPSKLRQMTRNAIQNHDRALDDVVRHLIAQDDALAAVDVAALLNQLISFLSNDAAAQGVQIQLAPLDGPVHVYARPSKLRLVLLALITRVLDMARSGSLLTIAIQSEVARNAYQLVFSFQTKELTSAHQWHFKRDADPLSENWWHSAIARVVHRDHGHLEATLLAPTEVRIALEYPVAIPG